MRKYHSQSFKNSYKTLVETVQNRKNSSIKIDSLQNYLKNKNYHMSQLTTPLKRGKTQDENLSSKFTSGTIRKNRSEKFSENNLNNQLSKKNPSEQIELKNKQLGIQESQITTEKKIEDFQSTILKMNEQRLKMNQEKKQANQQIQRLKAKQSDLINIQFQREEKITIMIKKLQNYLNLLKQQKRQNMFHGERDESSVEKQYQIYEISSSGRRKLKDVIDLNKINFKPNQQRSFEDQKNYQKRNIQKEQILQIQNSQAEERINLAQASNIFSHFDKEPVASNTNILYNLLEQFFLQLEARQNTYKNMKQYKDAQYKFMKQNRMNQQKVNDGSNNSAQKIEQIILQHKSWQEGRLSQAKPLQLVKKQRDQLKIQCCLLSQKNKKLSKQKDNQEKSQKGELKNVQSQRGSDLIGGVPDSDQANPGPSDSSCIQEQRLSLSVYALSKSQQSRSKNSSNFLPPNI